MGQFKQETIEQYDQLNGKQRQKVTKMYNRVNLIGKIITRTGFVLFVLVYLDMKNLEKHVPFLYDATVGNILVFNFTILIGSILLALLVTESMQAYYTSKYPYYTRKVGRYAAHMERIHSRARRR